MLIASNQLNKQLENGALSLYVLAGDEPLTKTLCLDSIRKHARLQGADERTGFVVDRHFNWQQITQFSQNISLFSSKRILEINITTGKPGVDGAKALIEIAQKIDRDTTLIIILPTLDRDAKNSKWYEALLKQGVVVDIKDVPINALPNWIHNQLAQQDQYTDTNSLAFIAHQVEGNLLAAHQEIQKLGLLFPKGEISAEQVKEAVLNVARFDAFQLGEAMLLGDKVRTARILQGLKDEGEQAVTVMNPLLWLIKPLLQIKLAQHKGEHLNQAMTAARVYADRQVLVKNALSRLSLRQIEAAMKKLGDIDRIGKGVMQGDAWLEISRLCFGLASISVKSR